MNTNINDKKDIDDILKAYNDSGNQPTDTPVEDPQKCAVMNDIDDYSTKTIATGEVCTIETAKLYGIFGKDKYFNSSVPATEQSDINLFVDNAYNKKLNYSLCSVDQSNYAYQNCVLTTKNPWKSINGTKEYCMLPMDITLPEHLVYNQETKKIDKPPDIPLYKAKKECCQEKWYDWFSIPDYHLGNRTFFYQNNSNVKCFAPCELGSVPDPDNNNEKCITKNRYYYGLYAKSLNYLPIAFIMLLGSTKDSLLKKHKEVLTNERNKLKDKGELTMDFELYNNIITNEVTQQNIFNVIKEDLRPHIRKLLSYPIDENNIIPPDPDIQTRSADLMSKENIADAYDIAKNFYDLSTAPDKTKEFFEWKKKLAEIGGFNMTDDKFFKQLLLLKKACNVAFDNTTSYSRDNILYVVNQDPEPSDPVRNPIKFDITAKDVTLAVSSNSSENSDKAESILASENISERRAQLLSEENKLQSEINDSGLELNLETGDPTKYDPVQQEYEASQPEPTLDKAKIFMVTVFAVVITSFIIALIIIIARLLWPYVSEFLNHVISGFIYMIYFTRDMFRGKYSPSRLKFEVMELQRSFLIKKINNDIARKL